MKKLRKSFITIKKIVINNFFQKILLFLLFSSVFSCMFCAGSYFPNVNEQIKASYISKEAKKQGGNLYSVTKPNDNSETFSELNNYGRELYGSTLSKTANCFIESKHADNYDNFLVQRYDGEFIPVNTISSPSNNILDINFNFEYLEGSQIPNKNLNFDSTNIYITDCFGKLLVDEGTSILDLIGKKTVIKTHFGGVYENFTIVGIIKIDSAGIFKSIASDCFIFTNFTFSLNYLSGVNKNIAFIYHPGRISLTTYLLLKKAVFSSDKYKDLYYDNINDSYVVGETDKFINSYSYNITITLLISVFLILLLCIAIFILWKRKIEFENKTILYSLTCSFIVLLILYKLVTCLYFKNIIILFIPYQGVLLSLAFFMVMFSMILWKFAKKSNKIFEVNI